MPGAKQDEAIHAPRSILTDHKCSAMAANPSLTLRGSRRSTSARRGEECGERAGMIGLRVPNNEHGVGCARRATFSPTRY